MNALTPDILAWLARNAVGLGVVACAVVALVETAKRALHSTGARMEAGGWRAVLRWLLPLVAGVGMGAVPGVWTDDVSIGLGALAGLVAGGPLGSLVIYPAVKSRIPGMLTSEARASTPQDPGSWPGGPTAAMLVPLGMAEHDAVGIGLGLLVGAAVVVVWALRTVLGRTAPPAPPVRTGEDIARAGEERARAAADVRATDATSRIEAGAAGPTETPEQRRARLRRLVDGAPVRTGQRRPAPTRPGQDRSGPTGNDTA